MRLLKVRAAQLIKMLLNGMLAECNDQITGALQIFVSRHKTTCLFGIDNNKCHIVRKKLNVMCLYVIIILIL